MRNEGVEKVERYSSGGRGTGLVGLVIVGAVALYGILDRGADFPAWFIALCVLFAALLWAILLRPALVLHDDEIELRNILKDRWIPYALITEIKIDQMTVVHTDDTKYIGAGFGRSRRMIRRDGASGGTAGLDLNGRFESGFAADPPDERRSIGWLVQDKVQRRAANARDLGAVPGPVRSAWSWPVVGLLGGLALVTLVLGLVG
ncbi:hypothetical protein [Pimelobacter simplex]|uniref:hypothetical protein n=1 Tax=Nocardioides simplex TaxID=2045 RepID=UPI003AAAA884